MSVADRHDSGEAVPYFHLRGQVGEEVVSASWRDGLLTVDALLFERARLLIALGETFSVEELELCVPAGLESPLSAALTLMRGFDLFTEAEIVLVSREGVRPTDLTITFAHAGSPTALGRTGRDG